MSRAAVLTRSTPASSEEEREQIKCEACGHVGFDAPKYRPKSLWRREAVLRTTCSRCSCPVTFPLGTIESELMGNYLAYALYWRV